MEILQAIKNRRSIRKFNKAKEISKDQIERLLEAARWAPSAGNLQSRFFYVVYDDKAKADLALAAFGQDFITDAAIVFVACADLTQNRYGHRGQILYSIQDATLGIYNLWLEAQEIGLGGAWVGAFDEIAVSRILEIPKHLRPIAILPIGYPAESPMPPPRKAIKQISKKI